MKFYQIKKEDQTKEDAIKAILDGESYVLHGIRPDLIDYELALLASDSDSLRHVPVELIDYKLARAFVIGSAYNLKFVPEDIRLEGLGELEKHALQKRSDSIMLIKNPSNDQWIQALSDNGMLIRYYKGIKSEEICLTAVQNNGYAIQFIKDQQEKVVIAALRQNVRCIKYVNINSMKIAREAVKQFSIQKKK